MRTTSCPCVLVCVGMTGPLPWGLGAWTWSATGRICGTGAVPIELRARSPALRAGLTPCSPYSHSCVGPGLWHWGLLPLTLKAIGWFRGLRDI